MRTAHKGSKKFCCRTKFAPVIGTHKNHRRIFLAPIGIGKIHFGCEETLRGGKTREKTTQTGYSFIF